MPTIGGIQVSQDVASLNADLFPEQAEKKPRKYLNQPQVYNGLVYDSIKEAGRARDLDLLKRAGEIVAWFPHVNFDLPGGVRYVADFVVIDKDWRVSIEDVKSGPTKTQAYRIKKKQFKERYGKEIIEK